MSSELKLCENVCYIVYFLSLLIL